MEGDENAWRTWGMAGVGVRLTPVQEALRDANATLDLS